MRENDQKKMLLSVLGVAILVVAVIGISFAAYSTLFTSSANTVTTGTIMVSYSESGNAIDIDDAMPITDQQGADQTDAFNFTVSTKADNALTVPYEINLTKVTLDCTGDNTPEGCYGSMLDTQVKAYLLKGETAVSETLTSGNPGKFIDSLTASTVRNGAKVLHTDQDVFSTTNEAAKTTSYTLKLWIDHNVNYTAVEGKEYHAKVNVDSHVNPIA